MAKGKSQPAPSAGSLVDDISRLSQAMKGQKKAELVTALLLLAQADHKILRQLNVRFKVVVAPDQLIDQTRQAIRDATAFDKRQMNRNFDYDRAAYVQVKRSFVRLIVRPCSKTMETDVSPKNP